MNSSTTSREVRATEFFCRTLAGAWASAKARLVLEPGAIAEFTDVIGVGEGEILGQKLVDAIFEDDSKEELLLALARQGRGFYVPSFYFVGYNEDGTVNTYTPTEEGVPARVGRAI